MDWQTNLIIGIGIVVIAKLIYDGLKANKNDKPTGNGNGKINAKDVQQMIRDNRCGAHEHIASGVTEMMVIGKQLMESHKMLREDMVARLENTGEKIDRLQDTSDQNFADTFERLHEVEMKASACETEIRVIKAKMG